NINASWTHPERPLFRLLDDMTLLDLDVGGRTFIASGHFADLQDVLQAFVVGRFSENGVLIVQERSVADAPEKLRSRGVRVVRAGHRQDAGDVRRLVEFLLDGVAGAAGSVAVRATGLNDEAVDHTMENDTVVIADFCEADDVLRMTRSKIGVQIDRDPAH